MNFITVGLPNWSENLQFYTVGQRDDGMIVSPSDGPIIILIGWEYSVRQLLAGSALRCIKV